MRFISELEKRYDWTTDQLESEWESAKSNPRSLWGTDDYGESVCSLSAGTSRELNHRKSVQTKEAQVTDDMASTFKSSLTQFWTVWDPGIVTVHVFRHWDCIQIIAHLVKHVLQHFCKRHPRFNWCGLTTPRHQNFRSVTSWPHGACWGGGPLWRNKLIHVYSIW